MRNKTANQWKKTGLPSVYDTRSRFSGKSIALQHLFCIAQCSSIQVDHVIMAKDAKGKGKGKPVPKGFSNAPDLQQMLSLS